MILFLFFTYAKSMIKDINEPDTPFINNFFISDTCLFSSEGISGSNDRLFRKLLSSINSPELYNIFLILSKLRAGFSVY